MQSEKHYSIIFLLNKFALSTSNSVILSPPSSISRIKELTFGIQIYGTFKKGNRQNCMKGLHDKGKV